jgi:hypothetical protein
VVHVHMAVMLSAPLSLQSSYCHLTHEGCWGKGGIRPVLRDVRTLRHARSMGPSIGGVTTYCQLVQQVPAVRGVWRHVMAARRRIDTVRTM